MGVVGPLSSAVRELCLGEGPRETLGVLVQDRASDPQQRLMWSLLPAHPQLTALSVGRGGRDPGGGKSEFRVPQGAEGGQVGQAGTPARPRLSLAVADVLPSYVSKQTPFCLGMGMGAWAPTSLSPASPTNGTSLPRILSPFS